jgi:hypothetical protein
MPGEKLVIKLWETVAEKGIGGKAASQLISSAKSS